jgi:hypothetical protein
MPIARDDMQAEQDIYETDYSAWIEGQVALLRQGKLQDLDRLHLAEELEAMGRRERNELVSRLIILIAHLLTWRYQPEHRTSGWRGFVVEQRVQVMRELRLSPSLKPFFAEAVQLAYPDALRIATKETGLQSLVFPAECPFDESELLDEDYWPDALPA